MTTYLGYASASYGGYLDGNPLNVKAFGAVGNGSTDDTAAIQSAIDTAPDGATVLIPPTSSFFKISSTLRITGRSKLTIAALAWGAQLKPTTTAFNLFTVDATSSQVTFAGLRLVGVSVGTEAVSALEINGGKCRVTGCEISGFNNGVHNWTANFFAGFTNFVADYNYIHDLVGNTSGNGYGVYTVAPHSLILGNRFENVPRHDVYCSGSDTGANYSVVEGNTSTGNGVQSVAVFNTGSFAAIKGVTVIGNTIQSCAIGIRFDVNTAFCSAIGNTIENSSAAALQLDGGVAANEQPNGNVFLGNTITNCQFDEPILLTNASRSIVAGNSIQSNGKLYGVYVTSTGSPPEFPTGNQVFGNTVQGQTSHAVYVDPTCVDTVTGQNYSTGTVSIGNDRDVVTYTSTSTPAAISLQGKGNVGRPVEIIFNPASPITISNFTGCREGQELICYFQTASVVTITNANAIFAAGATSFTSTANDTIRFILRGTNWVETGRSVN